MTLKGVREAMRILQLFGPPGTGKTTSLAESVRKAVNLRQDRNAVLVASLTNAAAKEIAGRDIPVNPSLVGTLHALCYRQMGCPPLIIKPKFIEEWNSRHYNMTLSLDKKHQTPEMDSEDGQKKTDKEECPGDELLQAYSLARHRMVPRERWSADAQYFAPRWEAFKQEMGAVDFDDLIEAGLSFEEPPFGAKLGIFDESQDFSALEFSVVKHWAQFQDYAMLAGDDMQCLYSWRGADPEAFINCGTEPPRFLSQSYRLPRIIQSYVEHWGAKIKVRQKKEYLPRDEEGKLLYSHATYQQPEPILKIIDQADAKGQTVMIQTACAYQLNNIIAVLRKAGVPYHNPFRLTNTRWNPLASHGRQTAVSRMAAYLAPMTEMRFAWTNRELQAWAPLMQADVVFVRGAKKRITELPDDDTVIDMATLQALFLPETLTPALAADPHWFFMHLLSAEQQSNALQYGFEINRKYGLAAVQTPKVIVGTVHSLKGTEASCVVLFPDLSPSGYEQWEAGGAQRDAVLRQFYVGLSRAKETLILAQPATRNAVTWT